MPIYTYKCIKCGIFDEVQKITSEPLKSCPKCGNNIKKLVSQFGFKLLGPGWGRDSYDKSAGNV